MLYPEVHKSSAPAHEALLKAGCKEVATQPLCYAIALSEPAQIGNLLAMTPHRYKSSTAGREAVLNLTEISVTVDVSLRVFQYSP
jgi:23S rRNA (guanine745-N1)-methyltransferase